MKNLTKMWKKFKKVIQYYTNRIDGEWKPGMCQRDNNQTKRGKQSNTTNGSSTQRKNPTLNGGF